MAEIRVTVDDKFLEDLKEKLGNPTTTGLVQDALAILNWGADARKDGRDILSATPDRKDVERFTTPSLSRVK
jgi:hypothetical protein